ncbi:response regulator transcription factor [Ramlibacter alkalitolerans]|jgi:FixJ family two-component response regulator|uniref:Response regulator transcription factor n=1 Tax=Ramlibacter alkalitolerans TaxID=2039631 RepID=A0ABS1JPN8_9BURK|nr:response regulator [Ramlibacter alkalitolerans]MBL0426235.1 response regulator transcription factor [Ramlibacter alkalitolerans]
MSGPVHRQTVFIVDDDPSVRDALALLLSLRGYPTAVFACAEDFLRALEPQWRGVVIADIRMPGMSGLEMQEALAHHPSRLPVIVVTAHGDVAAARQAFKFNAIDFLEKPFDHEQLLASIDRALSGLPPDASTIGTRPVASTLSAREREVMALVVEGLDNRAVGERLGISPRTVEVHKSRVMSKLGARNLAELIRIAQVANGAG